MNHQNCGKPDLTKTCTHLLLKYCTHCDIVYCVVCNREWLTFKSNHFTNVCSPNNNIPPLDYVYMTKSYPYPQVLTGALEST